MEAIKKVMLCPACGGCPEIALYDEEVHIGEKGNFIRLRKEEWNELVKKIRKGELTEV